MNRCDRCSNEATHFYRIAVNGREQRLALCADCAARLTAKEELSPLQEAADLLLFSPFFARQMPRQERTGVAQSAEAPSATQTLPKQTEKSLATLKAQLKRALRQEDYLSAAQLRDSIRALEEKKQ